MPYRRTATLAELRTALAGPPAVSRWFAVDQPRIDGFAAVTEDPYFIHTDPARAAAETPFGGTIAHGFLTLSLLAPMAYDAVPEIAGTRLGVNAGFDRVRFLAPVPAGARIRGAFALEALGREGADGLRTVHAVTVEIENAPKPALVATWITRVWGDFPWEDLP